MSSYLRDVGELEGANTVCTNRQVLWENDKKNKTKLKLTIHFIKGGDLAVD